MPQPLRRKVLLNFMVSAIESRSELAVKLSQIIAISSLMETRLSAILAGISGGNAEITVAMFQAVNSTDAQRSMLRSAAEVALAGHELDTLCDLLDEHRNRAKERNKIVHGIWCTADEYPDALLLARPADIAAISKRMAVFRHFGQSVHDEATDDIWKNCMIYRAQDFDQVLGRLISFDNQIAQFWVNLLTDQTVPLPNEEQASLPLEETSQDPPLPEG